MLALAKLSKIDHFVSHAEISAKTQAPKNFPSYKPGNLVLGKYQRKGGVELTYVRRSPPHTRVLLN